MSGSFLDRINPRILVVFSRAVMALGTPVVAFLVIQGPGLSGGTMDPISFCNVLFVGNLCAAFVVASYFGMGPIVQDLWKLRARTKLRLLAMGASASALSALIFMALESVTVTNAVLIARLGPILYAFAGALLLSFPIKRAEWIGFGVMGIGVLATVFGSEGFNVAKGDVLIMVSCVFYALTTLLSKGLLKECGLGSMVFARNFISAIIFFVIALYLFGAHHFDDALSGQLWIIMLIYALVIIVTSQFTWYSAISRLEPATVAKWTVLSPGLGIAYAFVINGEHPSMTQIVALVFVSVGIVVSNMGGSAARRPKDSSDGAENSLAAN